MPTAHKISRGQFIITTAKNTLPLSENWFKPDYWKQQDKIKGQSQGRSTTFFIDTQEQKLVLRHYYRGGMVRHFLRDTYLYSQLKNTRVFAELSILEKMKAWQLPVPTPVGGHITKCHLLFYRADILMAKIPNAIDLYEYLQANQLTNEQWRSLGATIGKFHQHGVYHADLNCHNIMRDNTGQFWLIDFDRARLQTDTANRTSWTSQNLGRLYRSFNKEKAHCTPFNFDEQDWEQLLIGYDSIS